MYLMATLTLSINKGTRLHCMKTFKENHCLYLYESKFIYLDIHLFLLAVSTTSKSKHILQNDFLINNCPFVNKFVNDSLYVNI